MDRVKLPTEDSAFGVHTPGSLPLDTSSAVTLRRPISFDMKKHLLNIDAAMTSFLIKPALSLGRKIKYHSVLSNPAILNSRQLNAF